MLPIVMVGEERFPVLGGDLMAALDTAHFQTMHQHSRGSIRLGI